MREEAANLVDGALDRRDDPVRERLREVVGELLLRR
jgi:hypothetical protein